MKTIYKKMIAVCVALVFVLACASTASADTIQISGLDGSTAVKSTSYKDREVPVSCKLRMAHGFIPGVPTRARFTCKFWNARKNVRINGVVKKVDTFSRFYKARITPGAIWYAKSCRPPEGTPPVNGYNGICLRENAIPQWYASNIGERVKTVNHDLAQPYLDWTYGAKAFKPRWLGKNRSASYSVLVTFPRCLALDQVDLPKSELKNDWPCQPGSMSIGVKFTLRSKTGWRGSGSAGFYASQSLYIHQPTPPSATP